MSFDYYQLFQYIFGDRAKTANHTKELSQPLQEAQEQKKAEKTRQFFKPYLNEPRLRATLHQSSLVHLENLLFGTAADPAIVAQPFPEEKAIERLFNDHEYQYQYFKSDKNNALIAFGKIFKLCKLIADVFEKNNDDENELAAINAYKVLVIFWDGSTDVTKTVFELNKYLKTHQYYNGSDIPLDDAVKYAIPQKVAEKPINLKEWQRFIRKNGRKAFIIFNLAVEIEARLPGKFPKNMQDMLEVRKQITYKRSSEHPEISDLCIQHNLKESVFEKCLEIHRIRKVQDQLPDMPISGEDVGYPRYWLVKLPIDDLHAYVLGKLTNCCLSVGSGGEKSIMDALTKNNNGLYVLIKSKTVMREEKSCVLPPLINGRIDYSNFDIVGNGYAWLSTNGNLVFDSWENRCPGSDDKIISLLLRKFAECVIHDKQFGIRYVAIGIGSKTPKSLQSNVILCEENMREGEQYCDSSKQSMVACDVDHRTAIAKEFHEFLRQRLQVDNEKLAQWVKNNIFTDHEVSESKKALQFGILRPLLTDEINLGKDSSPNNKLSWRNVLKIQTILPLSEGNWVLLIASMSSDKSISSEYFRNDNIPPNDIYTFLRVIKKLGLDNNEALLKYCLRNFRMASYYMKDIEFLSDRPDFIYYKSQVLADPKLASGIKRILEKCDQYSLTNKIGVVHSYIKNPRNFSDYERILDSLKSHGLENNLEVRNFCFENCKSIDSILVAFSSHQKMVAAKVANNPSEVMRNYDEAMRFCQQVMADNKDKSDIEAAKAVASAYCVKALTHYEADQLDLAIGSYESAFALYKQHGLYETDPYVRAVNRYAQLLVEQNKITQADMIFSELESYWSKPQIIPNPNAARFYSSYAEHLMKHHPKRSQLALQHYQTAYNIFVVTDGLTADLTKDVEKKIAEMMIKKIPIVHNAGIEIAVSSLSLFAGAKRAAEEQQAARSSNVKCNSIG